MVEAFRPSDLNETLHLMSQQPSLVMAGGTDLMVRHRNWRGLPPAIKQPVIFIGHLEELQRIDIDNNQISIGAGCSLNQILTDVRVPTYIKAPLLQMASPGIRNMATIGGNICNSSPAGDSLPMLYALDAKLRLQTADGTTLADIGDFIVGPGQNILESNQLLTSILVPLNNYSQYYYRKVGTRKANSISKVSMYGVVQTDSNFIHKVRIALGAVAPTVVRSIEAEQLLAGIRKSDLAAKSSIIYDCYAGIVKPVNDVRSNRTYRTIVSLNLVRDFIAKELSG